MEGFPTCQAAKVAAEHRFSKHPTGLQLVAQAGHKVNYLSRPLLGGRTTMNMPKRSSDRLLTNLQKIDITRRHLTRRVLQGDLAVEYHVSKATVSRAIEEVLSNGWVVVSIKENYSHPATLKPELADRLAARYHGVENVYVLEILEAPTKGTDYATWSDHVHRVLGGYLGRVHVKPAIGSDDKIGVSSGRGVYYTIEGIFSDLIRAENATVLSLTGSFENRAHGVREPAIMDGDTNAALLALGFGRMVRLQTVGREVVVSPSDKRPAWFADPPNRALVGLGVLEPTNRILLQGSTLKPLHTELEELHQLVNEAAVDNYIPCADMCNCMIWIPPPKGVVVKHEVAIRSLIEKINSYLCVIPFERLLLVRGCWIAAGTARKASALHHCLERGLRVNGLCVDTSLAEELLRLSG
jgi:DNA-binding transcriptional regulator LsrR (DeoR family)